MAIRAGERPPWWPTAEQKAHADAACAHPDRCNLQAGTFHNTCLIRPVDSQRTGWCMDHGQPVYRDGIDWRTDTDQVGVVFVLDGTHRATGGESTRVTVACPDGTPDPALAEAAGYGPEHFGYHVTRYTDGTALVLLHND